MKTQCVHGKTDCSEEACMYRDTLLRRMEIERLVDELSWVAPVKSQRLTALLREEGVICTVTSSL